MEIKKIMKCDIAIVGGGNAGLVAAIEDYFKKEI